MTGIYDKAEADIASAAADLIDAYVDRSEKIKAHQQAEIAFSRYATNLSLAMKAGKYGTQADSRFPMVINGHVITKAEHSGFVVTRIETDFSGHRKCRPGEESA